MTPLRLLGLEIEELSEMKKKIAIKTNGNA